MRSQPTISKMNTKLKRCKRDLGKVETFITKHGHGFNLDELKRLKVLFDMFNGCVRQVREFDHTEPYVNGRLKLLNDQVNTLNGLLKKTLVEMSMFDYRDDLISKTNTPVTCLV